MKSKKTAPKKITKTTKTAKTSKKKIEVIKPSKSPVKDTIKKKPNLAAKLGIFDNCVKR